MLNKICILCVALLVGCASGHVGPRVGVDLPVSGIGAEGNVTSTSSQVGFVGGFTFEGMFTRTWGLRADPQIRTIGGDVGFAGSTTSGDGVVSVSGVLKTNSTFLELPIVAMFSPTDSGSTIHPFFCFGLMLSAATSTTLGASGTQTYTENGQSVSAPFSYQENEPSFNGPFASVLFSGGVRIPISQSWELRAEARLQQMFTDADIAGFVLYAPGYSTLVRMRVSAPTTSVGITLGMMLRL